MGRVYRIRIPLNIPSRVRRAFPSLKLDRYSDTIFYHHKLDQDSSLRYTVLSVPRDIIPPSSYSYRFIHRLQKLHLQLPQFFDPAIHRLAQGITQRASSHEEKAREVLRYLRDNYAYSLSRKKFQKSPLYDFLFIQKKGHCEYFSTAMVLLLRSIGVPARNVTGFYGAKWNSFGKYYAVRQNNAHSWVEVYLPQTGWKRFDPTPHSAPKKEGGFWRKTEEYIDSLRLRWHKFIIEYDLIDQLKALRAIRKKMVNANRKLQSLSLSKEWQKLKKRGIMKIFIMLGGAVFYLLVLIFLWLRWRRYPIPKKPKLSAPRPG